jgi:hypothetical protein
MPHDPSDSRLEENSRLIREIALLHPAWGSIRIARALEGRVPGLRPHTVQMHLIRQGLGRRDERLAALECDVAETGRSLTDEQAALIGRRNPAFARHDEAPAAAGDLLVHDVIQAGLRPRFGRLYVHALVDTFSSHAFARLSRTPGPQPSIALFDDQVQPHFLELGQPIGTVETALSDCVTMRHADAVAATLAQSRIGHRIYRGVIREANGFLIAFRRQLRREFLDHLPDGDFFDSLEDLQTRMDLWLLDRNFGLS